MKPYNLSQKNPSCPISSCFLVCPSLQGPPGAQGKNGEKGDTGPTGPTGPQGTSITILGSFNSKEELDQTHPTGNAGNSYIVDGNLYVWSPEDNIWKDVGVIRGPQGLSGPQGEKGEIGPTGPTGPEEIPIAYIVTFQNNTADGYTVDTNNRIPLSRLAMDNANICYLNTNTGGIKLNKEGVYRVDFMVNVYYTNDQSPSQKEIAAIGFKKTGENIVYAGRSTWLTPNSTTQIIGQGTFIIANPTTEELELVNMSNHPLTINSPQLTTTTSDSYFINPIVTIIIQYLG